MNLFQWLMLPVFLGILFAEGLGVVRKKARWKLRLIRFVVWTAATVAVAQPELTQDLAHLIGIGRGADLVLYLFVLTFLVVSFHLYTHCVWLHGQLTDVVRYLAIHDARRKTCETDNGETLTADNLVGSSGVNSSFGSRAAPMVPSSSEQIFCER
jgi:hypothetical protein